MLFGALMVVAPSASATQGVVHKVTICHRTNAVTNPYVTPTVDFSGGDGAIVHGPNHYEHQDDVGGVFDFDAVDAPDYDTTYPKPRNGEQWEDIIPPVPYGEGTWSEDGSTWSGQFTSGLNWDDEGKAVYFGTADGWPALNQEFYAEPHDAVCGAPGEPQDPPVVIVEKDVPNVEVEDLFNFGITGHDDFDLADGEQDDFEVTAGSITVGEDLTDPDGYTLTGVVCTLTSAEFPEGTVLNTTLDDGEVTFDIGDDEVVECVFTNVPDTAPTYSASLVKTNNANGTGDYTDDETAPTAGADVPFKVVITNTGTGNLKVDGLSDNWPGLVTPVNLLTLGAGELVCTTPDGDDGGTEPDPFVMAVDAVILPGAANAVTCLFTLDDYSPAAGGSITNTVTLDTEETGDVQDTSIVRTPGGGGCVVNCGPPPPIEEIDPVNLTVVKAVTGEVPETWSFSFDNDVLGGFELTNESESTSDEVDAGEYVITEAPSDDADLTSIDCSGTDDEVVDLDAGTVSVDLGEGDSVTCTFTNDFPEVEPGVVVNPPAPAPAVSPPAVLGSQVVRSLPRTGSSSQTLATVGAVLILFGAVITLGSRRKLALER